jgi:hypothetical protein
MLLITLVVRSTRQKDKALIALARAWHEGTQAAGQCYIAIDYSLFNGTDKTAKVAIEGIVAHGPGGNQEKLLVL